MSESRQNVCVVGGGPAGLAAAIALKLIGYPVTIVDCAIPPIDKACGEGLMPDSLLELRKLGIEIAEDAAFSFRGVRFVDHRSSVSADFPTGAARGVRRTVLHRLMIERAQTLDIELIWNAKHVRLAPGGVYLDNALLPAVLIVGADGLNSQIRRQAGLNAVRQEQRRFGFRCHYRIAPWSPYVELYWGRLSQIYLTPVDADQVCVAAISSESNLRVQEALYEFPELSARLKTTEAISTEMGGLSLSRSFKSVYRGNVALVGDASGSVDAITGEGICVSVKQAHALAAAVKRGNLALYEDAHRRLMRRPQTMASLMLTLEHNGPLRSRVLSALSQTPELFQSLLAIHVGAAEFRNLCSWSLIDFARALVSA